MERGIFKAILMLSQDMVALSAILQYKNRYDSRSMTLENYAANQNEVFA